MTESVAKTNQAPHGRPEKNSVMDQSLNGYVALFCFLGWKGVVTVLCHICGAYVSPPGELYYEPSALSSLVLSPVTAYLPKMTSAGRYADFGSVHGVFRIFRLLCCCGITVSNVLNSIFEVAIVKIDKEAVSH